MRLLCFCFGLDNAFEFALFKFLFMLLQVEVDWSIRLVSVTIGYDSFDVWNNFRYELSDSGQVIWFFYSQSVHILEKIGLPVFGKFMVLNSLYHGLFYDFVVDVSYVHAKLNIVPEMPGEYPPDHIIGDVVFSMAHVAVRVDCWPARVPSDIFSMHRLELFELIRETVLNF